MLVENNIEKKLLLVGDQLVLSWELKQTLYIQNNIKNLTNSFSKYIILDLLYKSPPNRL